MAAIVVLVSGAPADFGGSLPAVARLEFLDLCPVIFADIDPVPQDNCGCGHDTDDDDDDEDDDNRCDDDDIDEIPTATKA